MGSATTVSRRRARQVAAAVGVLAVGTLASLVISAGVALWLPKGAAGINHIVLAVIGFPVVWVAVTLSLYAYGRDRRAWWCVAAITLVHLALVGGAFLV